MARWIVLALAIAACDAKEPTPRRSPPLSMPSAATPSSTPPEDLCFQRHSLRMESCDASTWAWESPAPGNQCRAAAAEVFRACMRSLGHEVSVSAMRP